MAEALENALERVYVVGNLFNYRYPNLSFGDFYNEALWPQESRSSL